MDNPVDVDKNKMAEEIAKRIAEKPSILDDLKYRLENEKPEDWDDI